MLTLAAIIAVAVIQGANERVECPSYLIDAVNKAAPAVPRTRAEMRAAVAYLGENKFKLFDSDEDGQLDGTEWQVAEYAVYMIYNKARDCRLRLDEFVRFDLGPEEDPYRITPSKESLSRAFQKLDAGKKGYLTPSDLWPRTGLYFRLNDRNHDGRVSPEEVRLTAINAPLR